MYFYCFLVCLMDNSLHVYFRKYVIARIHEMDLYFCHLFSCASHLKFIQEVLQGAAVTLAELGDYTRAVSLLQDLAKVCSLLFWIWISSTLCCSSPAVHWISFIVLLKFIIYILQEKPSDPDVFRLLGEVKYELKDYEGSAAAYRVSTMVMLSLIYGELSMLYIAFLDFCSCWSYMSTVWAHPSSSLILISSFWNVS